MVVKKGVQSGPNRKRAVLSSRKVRDAHRTRHLAPGVVVGVAAPQLWFWLPTQSVTGIGWPSTVSVPRLARERQADERLGARHGGFV